MTTPIEITPEMRQAVLDAECERVGHQIDISTVIVAGEGRNSQRVRGPEGQMPHVTCTRCGHVWILISRSGRTYPIAERRFRERLIASDPEALPPA